MCGDSTSAADVAQLLAGETAQLLHADPPYGMGKAADGVANDNLYGAKLDAFQMAWWRAFRAHLAPNATAYIWGNSPDLWRLWYAGGLGDSEPLTMTNEIVWDKKSIAGMASPEMTQYPEASERCLFFKIGRHTLLPAGNSKDDYWPGWDSIRTWLIGERDKAGWRASDLTRIVGNHMQGHWFGKSQWQMISERDYIKLAKAAEGRAFTRPFVELQAEHQAQYAVYVSDVLGPRGEEFRAGRPYFDNAHDVMRDVWEFSRVTGDERHGHATPKPVAMMERVMRSSLRDAGLCIEPFGGSGSTLMGAERTGRRCFSMELQGMYVDVIVRRWQAHTGQEAVLESTGQTFAEVQAERVTDEVPA